MRVGLRRGAGATHSIPSRNLVVMSLIFHTSTSLNGLYTTGLQDAPLNVVFTLSDAASIASHDWIVLFHLFCTSRIVWVNSVSSSCPIFRSH